MKYVIPALLCCICTFPVNAAENGIAILPESLTLTGPEARHQLLVQEVRNGDFTGELTEGLIFAISNPGVVTIKDGQLTPVANGTATVTVKSGEQTATATVTVTAMDQPFPWEFRNHVLPVLSKAGCNSGACHGALAGKGGFKLSLRGYDPIRDHFVITKQARGRRVELADPARSLFLTKPSGAIPHKGGVRFEVGSLGYRVLSEWITQGAVAPSENDPELSRLEILPALSLLKPGQKQQMLVRAHYTDGRTEDVTRWVKFTSADETVARINDAGEVSVIGYGEGAVTAWYSSKIVIARVTAPYEYNIPAKVYEKTPVANFIDELTLKQLQRLNLKPSPPADDATFLRRAYIDTIGKLPTLDETRTFLADKSPDKRTALIEKLLARDEFVDYWTYKWSDILLINGTLLRPEAVKAYYTWIRGHVKQNTPWDKFVREIVTAQGSSYTNGATNFYALHQTPEDMSENVSQAFMGLSIACAKCHNHPLEKWTNNQYFAMANLFSRVRAKGWGGDSRSGNGLRTLYVVPTGELVQPLTGKPQPPAPLDAKPIRFDDTNDRREYLADWLTSPENPYFSRAITNRVWANFFGVGLVESVDDLRVSNPASNEELLSAAANYLAKNDFDLKALMRVILQSESYQRSSQPLEENEDERRFYARYYPRRMMAEVLLDAISDVTQVPTEFTEVLFPGADRKKTDFYPKGTRALELYDSAVDSYFLKTFGRNQRNITCECERSDKPSMVQVLHLSNGTTINDKLAAKGSCVDKLLERKLTPEQMVEEVYLTCLSRYPTEEERTKLSVELTEAPESEARIAVEDLYWAVLVSKEFLFNH